ncbi:LysM domain-containing protein [Hirsutella rhossiliensis]|uniref:LysM domain-containing protein n=1 Tax=Hirsutella rhossiliensis TaxID=111463 RepID=A0A9P8MWY7_9HYPO|nr:LysM domain-containing protein [Hirsutella rhossiliensis]KAH0961919.1 LysM domain-containing protein [Hirsutella rhossiliensis]
MLIMVRPSGLALLSVLAMSFVTPTAAATGKTRVDWPYGERGPEMDHDTWVSLINATPYRWARVYQHSYQMGSWGVWPEYLEPGQSVQTLAERRNGFFIEDSAAEVRYQLEGTARPMGLQVEYRRGLAHRVWVRFVDELETLNNARGTEHELGFVRRPGGVGFLLAGSEEAGFVSNDGPLQWMQASLPLVGHLPLRELALPRTHHSGMWKAVQPVMFGCPANTLTHDDDLWNQLGNGGIRVLDLRATRVGHEFRESHVSEIGILGWQGMIGAGIEEMIDIVNRFNDQYPGELIILDVHREARSRSRGWQELDEGEVLDLYKLFKLLRHRLRVPDDEDLTTWPLGRFIANGTSAVLVRFHQSWLKRAPDGFPGGAEGFVTDRQLPYLGDWSNAAEVADMVRDQLTQLAHFRPRRDSPAFNAQWIITQNSAQTVFPLETIIQRNAPAWRTLYHEFWNALSDQTYPNWITVDASHHSQLKAMAMAINLCLGARKCGSLGGRVRGSSVQDRYLARANGTEAKVVHA